MTGEWITRAAVWLALAGYAGGLLTFLLSGGNRRLDSFARMLWTAGCIALVAHVLFAYHFFHGWSQTSALKETARQTYEVYGLHWSGGLYINFLLMTAWCADVLWWWRGLDQYRTRPKIISRIWQFFLFFIFFNATVIFADGFVRWIGILFTLVILILWAFHFRRISLEERPSLWKS